MYTKNQSTPGKRHLTYKCPIQSSHLNLEQWDISKHAELLSHRNTGNARICFSKISLKKCWIKSDCSRTSTHTEVLQEISSVKKPFAKSQVYPQTLLLGDKNSGDLLIIKTAYMHLQHRNTFRCFLILTLPSPFGFK